MRVMVLALMSSFLACAFAAPSFALGQGGMFEERNGAFYEQRSSQRSNLGAGGYANQAYKTQTKKKKRQQTASLSYTDSYSGGVGKRPGKWCGWWMRTQLGGGPHLNVAWNWRNYGSSSGPQVGAVVVWRHHVGIITGQAANGQWIVKSGNDGGRVRERARSVKGAIFRI